MPHFDGLVYHSNCASVETAKDQTKFPFTVSGEENCSASNRAFLVLSVTFCHGTGSPGAAALSVGKLGLAVTNSSLNGRVLYSRLFSLIISRARRSRLVKSTCPALATVAVALLDGVGGAT